MNEAEQDHIECRQSLMVNSQKLLYKTEKLLRASSIML
jgi:hypothetical protein